MRIAWLANPEGQIPPSGYGGGERTAATLIPIIRKWGHSVALYAGEGSTLEVDELHIIPMRDDTPAEERLLIELHREGLDYDVIIDCTANHLVGQSTNFPHALSIMGGDPFKMYPHDNVRNKVYKSPEFAWFMNRPNNPCLPPVLGESPEDVQLVDVPDDPPYLLYVGVVREFKGVHIAADVAKMLGWPLRVYGPKVAIESEYFDKIVNHDAVDYRGILEQEGRDAAFGGAAAFLYPVQVCDCQPNAPKESMLRGTPVIATPNGGIRGFLKPHVNGYFAGKMEHYVNAVRDAQWLFRKVVRQSIIEQTRPEYAAMVLLSLCGKVARGESWE